MVDESLLPSVIQSLQKYTDLPDDLSETALKDRLTETIVYMLLHKMDKLTGILYRIDVREQQVKEAFAQPDSRMIAPKLAELIIEREVEKAETRRRYKG